LREGNTNLREQAGRKKGENLAWHNILTLQTMWPLKVITHDRYVLQCRVCLGVRHQQGGLHFLQVEQQHIRYGGGVFTHSHLSDLGRGRNFL